MKEEKTIGGIYNEICTICLALFISRFIGIAPSIILCFIIYPMIRNWFKKGDFDPGLIEIFGSAILIINVVNNHVPFPLLINLVLCVIIWGVYMGLRHKDTRKETIDLFKSLVGIKTDSCN